MNKVRVAVMASGEGTNAEALIRHAQSSAECPYEIVCIVTNKSDAGVLRVAAAYGVPSILILFAHRDEHEIAADLLDALSMHCAEFVCLAGFLRKIPHEVSEVFKQKIINIHPSLLPSFGGKGMYGRFVFEAVLASGVPVTGVTIHHVSDGYDEGAVIFREEIGVGNAETVESLAEKTRAVEHRVYPLILASECLRLRDISPV